MPTLISAPAVEPIALADAKAHLNILDDADDSLISAQIVAARQRVERHLGQSLIATTWDSFFDAFPQCAPLTIAGGPLISVDSVNYYDSTTGAETVLSADDYVVDLASEPARVAPVGDWPKTAKRINAVRVRYIAGYGTTSDDVPDAIKQAILLTAGTFYENRESVVTDVRAVAIELPLGVPDLLAGYRNYQF